jgi:hypothetical protein
MRVLIGIRNIWEGAPDKKALGTWETSPGGAGAMRCQNTNFVRNTFAE